MEKSGLRENAVHGTQGYPYAPYSWDGMGGFQVPLHWHSEAEIIYVKEGPCQVTVNTTKYAGEAPALFFVGSGEIHSLSMEPGTVETAVVYAPGMLEFASYDSLQHMVLDPWMKGQLRFPTRLTPKDQLWEEALALYQEIWQAAGTKEAGAFLRLKAGLYRLLACFYDKDGLIRTDEKRKEDLAGIDTLKKVLEFVRQNYERRITVDEIAAVAGMNAQYFCRYFKKHTGKTVTEYLNEVRITQAARLLTQTEDKILNVAIQCGYENVGYFISRFRRCKGMAPSEYRERMKKSK